MADRAQDEHARWLALKSLIDSGLHHADLDAVLARIDEEPDGTVADGARGHLVKNGGLTDEDLRRLRSRPGFEVGPMRRIVDEACWLRDAEAAADETELRRVVATGIKSVQQLVVHRDDLPRPVLEQLASDGATRAIRNVARQRLNRRRP